MKNFAVIKDSKVINCIVAESKESAEQITGETCIEYFLISIGWSYSNGVFSPPAE